MTLLNLIERSTRDYFIGVMQLEDRQVVGYVEDPIGIDLNAVQLQHPAEFCTHAIANNGETRVDVKFIAPVLGVPVETVLSGDVTLYSGDSELGNLYIGALRHFVEAGKKTKYNPSLIVEPHVPKKEPRHVGH